MKSSLFQEYWSNFSGKSHKERARYFSSLSKSAQRSLLRSFFEDGWCELIVRNIVDVNLDHIKKTYDIDVIDLRIKAMKGRTFLVDKNVWDEIEEALLTYKEYYDSKFIFGDLSVKPWGKNNQFYCIKGELHG